MYKVVDLLKRRSNLSVDVFQAEWKAASRVMSAVPGLRRYVQSHALPQGYGRGELLFDAIAEMWFDDSEGCVTALSSPAFARASHSAERWIEPDRAVRMAVDVHVIKNGAIPPNAVKNIEFVNRRPGMPLDRFRAYWRDVHGPLASKIPVLDRYEQNHLRASVYMTEPQPAFDGLAITWFHSTADMKKGARTPEYEATRADERNFLPDGHLPIIIAREHVIVG